MSKSKKPITKLNKIHNNITTVESQIDQNIDNNTSIVNDIRVLKHGIAGDIQKTFNNYTHLATDSIDHITKTLDMHSNFAQEILHKYSSVASNAMQESMVNCRDMIKCKDVMDIMAFQSNTVNKTVDTLVNLFLDITNISHDLALNTIQNISDKLDDHSKYLS